MRIHKLRLVEANLNDRNAFPDFAREMHQEDRPTQTRRYWIELR